MSRAETLVATAKMRAQITACVKNAGTVLSPADIAEHLGLEKNKQLFALIYRMAENGLLTKVPIDGPDYSYGYVSGNSETTQKRASKEQGKETPIDVRINKRQGSITIRYAGLVITLSKEE